MYEITFDNSKLVQEGRQCVQYFELKLTFWFHSPCCCRRVCLMSLRSRVALPAESNPATHRQTPYATSKLHN